MANTFGSGLIDTYRLIENFGRCIKPSYFNSRCSSGHAKRNSSVMLTGIEEFIGKDYTTCKHNQNSTVYTSEIMPNFHTIESRDAADVNKRNSNVNHASKSADVTLMDVDDNMDVTPTEITPIQIVVSVNDGRRNSSVIVKVSETEEDDDDGPLTVLDLMDSPLTLRERRSPYFLRSMCRCRASHESATHQCLLHVAYPNFWPDVTHYYDFNFVMCDQPSFVQRSRRRS